MSDDVSSSWGKTLPLPQPVLLLEPLRFGMAARRLYRGDVEVRPVPNAAAALGLLLERRGETGTEEEHFDVIWRGVHVSDESPTKTIGAVRQARGDPTGSREVPADE